MSANILETNTENAIQFSRAFYVRIEAIYAELKSAERKAADALLRDPSLLINNNTIGNVASVADCSEATLVRLSRKLGYKGFPDMKENAFEDADKDHLYPTINKDDSTDSVIDKFFSIAKNALDDTRELNSTENIDFCASLLRKAERIQFVGAGDAHQVAYAGFLKFYKAGYLAMCSSEHDVQLLEASKLKENDVIIAISNSGLTKSVVELAKCARKQKAHVIGITSRPLSPLAKVSDTVLLTPVFSKDTYNEILAQRLPAQALIETLYLLTIARSERNPLESIQKANRVLAKNKYGE